MTQPLSVNAQSNVEMVDSCNCCFFPMRRRKKKDEKVQEVFEKVITQAEKPEVQVGETQKG